MCHLLFSVKKLSDLKERLNIKSEEGIVAIIAGTILLAVMWWQIKNVDGRLKMSEITYKFINYDQKYQTGKNMKIEWYYETG